MGAGEEIYGKNHQNFIFILWHPIINKDERMNVCKHFRCCGNTHVEYQHSKDVAALAFVTAAKHNVISSGSEMIDLCKSYTEHTLMGA